MMIFQRFPTFYIKSEFSSETQHVLRDLRNFSRFLVPRGPDAPGLIKPMQFHPFLVVFGAPGNIFAKKDFSQNYHKIEKSDFLADFSFFDEDHDFREIHRLAKTPIFLVVYQWFWRVDGPANAKSTKFTKMPEFL